jgi:hypothetical protein
MGPWNDMADQFDKFDEVIVTIIGEETLARLLSHRSKPPNVDVCPHTIFIRPSILRHKPTNLLPLGFEAQTKKLSQ